MATQYPNQPDLRPIEQWLSNGLNDDVLLHSPTTGVFFGDKRVGEGEHPTAYFAEDQAYAKGYAYWESRGSLRTSEALGELSVGVFMTDPNSPDGLGDLRAFKELVKMADVVGFAGGRGVNARLTPNERVAETPGLIVPDPRFESDLTDIVYSVTKKMPFSFDVPANAPVPTAIERRLFELAAAQGDRYDPTLALLGADMIYCNSLQWGMAGIGGAEVAKQEEQPNKVLLVVGGEHEQLARKVSLLGDIAVESFGASYEIERDEWNRLYAMALKTGIIPGWVMH